MHGALGEHMLAGSSLHKDFSCKGYCLGLSLLKIQKYKQYNIKYSLGALSFLVCFSVTPYPGPVNCTFPSHVYLSCLLSFSLCFLFPFNIGSTGFLHFCTTSCAFCFFTFLLSLPPVHPQPHSRPKTAAAVLGLS